MSFNHIPGISSQPQTLVVRNRKKSIQLTNLFDELERLDQLDGDDDEIFRTRSSKRRQCSKTLKERKLERNTSHNESSLKARKTLAERITEMKENDEVNAKNLATLMRYHQFTIIDICNVILVHKILQNQMVLIIHRSVGTCKNYKEGKTW